MKGFRFFAAALVLSAAGSAWALDSVKTTSGISISGKVVKIDWDIVVVETGLGDNKGIKEVPTGQIVTIFFDSGSTAVKKALLAAKTDIAVKHQYADGLKSLAKIKPDDIDIDYLKQDYDFYNALANAKLALGGSADMRDAGQALLDFVKNNPKSYHFLEAVETLGDLFVAMGSYEKAEEYYGKLAKAPWPETQMRASVLLGRAQLAQKKFDDARKAFRSVIGNTEQGAAAEAERTAAQVGNALVLVGEKKGEEAVKILTALIAKTDADNAELMARIYNALGTAYLELGDLNEAKFAFLHTDMLYSSVADAHAEALANLADIWQQLHNADRAADARKTLEKLYKDSRWAKGEGKP